jgi:tetratricopeptide (TPR) repeat protein
LGEQAGDLSQVALLHEGIGNVLSVQELYSEALPHFDRNYEINKSLNTGVYVGYAAIGRASVLWQIGRFKETKAALDEVSSIAQRPQGVNKQLMTYALLIDARSDLSNGELRVSKEKSHQAIELAGTQNKDAAVQARCTLGLAQARSTAAPAGTRFCEQAVDIATLTGDPQLLSSALLAWAEAMLENGDARRALETALKAQNSFARFGREESEWRAWLVAAQASQQLGEQTSVLQYASYAAARLSNLEQKWGAEAYNGYLSRPDIQHLRGQLGQLVKP